LTALCCLPSLTAITFVGLAWSGDSVPERGISAPRRRATTGGQAATGCGRTYVAKWCIAGAVDLVGV
jgi:hypothetical protein